MADCIPASREYLLFLLRQQLICKRQQLIMIHLQRTHTQKKPVNAWLCAFSARGQHTIRQKTFRVAGNPPVGADAQLANHRQEAEKTGSFLFFLFWCGQNMFFVFLPSPSLERESSSSRRQLQPAGLQMEVASW